MAAQLVTERLVLRPWQPDDAGAALGAYGEAGSRRIGMEWVGEAEKYRNLRLQEYRLTPADLAEPR